MLNFFDSRIQIGQSSIASKTPKSCETVDSLLKEMDYFGIDESLVQHHACRYCARSGNEMLLKSIEGYERLHPCCAVTPHALQKRDTPEHLVMELKDRGVKAVSLWPASKGFESYPLKKSICGNLFDTLRKHEIPVFCCISLQDIDDICREYPDLTIVNTAWFSGALVPLMKQHQRLFYVTSLLTAHNGLELLCQHIGADRLIFGTSYGFDTISPGMTINALTMAKIPHADKEKISSANIRKLLKIPMRDKLPKKRWKDPFIDSLRNGRTVQTEIIVDAHAHTFTNELATLLKPDGDGMIEEMDHLGINMACVAANGSMSGGETRAANITNAQLVKANPERFVGYTRVNPNRQDEMNSELCFYYKQGIRNIKLHPNLNQYPVTGDKYRPAFRFAMEHNSVVLSHSDNNDLCSPGMFDEIAAKYPKVKIIIGHAGNCPSLYEQTIEVIQKHPNLYTDTSGWCATHAGVLEYMVVKLGSDRILFGTDFTAISASFQMGAVVYSEIPIEDKRNIMGLNAVRLFGLDKLK